MRRYRRPIFIAHPVIRNQGWGGVGWGGAGWGGAGRGVPLPIPPPVLGGGAPAQPSSPVLGGTLLFHYQCWSCTFFRLAYSLVLASNLEYTQFFL